MLPLTFASPLILAALLALPALWWLLRVTPPRPKTIPFPPLRIILDMVARQERPARTPIWLLLMRMLLVAAVIVAMAGPVWKPQSAEPARGSGPLLLLVDAGWPSAPDWSERQKALERLIGEAAAHDRPIAILSTAERPQPVSLQDPGTALQKVRAMRPAPFMPDRMAVLPVLAAFLEREKAAGLAWLTDRTSLGEDGAFVDRLAEVARGHDVVLLSGDRDVLALAGTEDTGQGLSVRLVRAGGAGGLNGVLRAFDMKSQPLADAEFTVPAGADETRVVLQLPLELRNEIARIEIANGHAAGAVALIDETKKRRRVGIVSGVTVDVSQPLLSPTYYVARALEPFSEVRVPRQGTIEAIGDLLDAKVSVLILADVGALPDTLRKRVDDFVVAGGLLLRFAGNRLAGGNDDLVPVKLRRGGRALGGALSWDAPRKLAPFDPASPFAGITLPTDVAISRQLLAEPEADLTRKTWASLADGTPIVTADRRGAGLVVLFHVTADTSWSNLPLSGLFVEMLRRTVALSGVGSLEAKSDTGGAEMRSLPPFRTLDGFGVLGSPPATAKPAIIQPGMIGGPETPPGFYGDQDAPMAINALAGTSRLATLDVSRLGARMEALTLTQPIDLRPALLALVAALFALDTLAALLLGGGLRALVGARAAMTVIVVLATGGLSMGSARAEPISPKDAEAALATRFAYIITGDATVDETSRAGLAGLSAFLSTRTSLDPAEPMGVDPARDDLAVYPLIYWPMVAGRSVPSETAIRKVDAFMKNGGTVLFDTRDAGLGLGGVSPETKLLRDILAGMSVPDLEPVPADHVITKAFYLIDNFPGRYASGQTWIESIPRDEGPDAERPARAGDGVSPIIITSNDLAAAWASGRRGEPLYPLAQGAPRQREMSFRAGVNIAMYTLTGNYKADQVHVPALLERLGQ
jgi:hypothetical protein